MYHLSSIANDVIVAELISVEAVVSPIICLPLPSRRREEALLAFSSTSHTWRIARVIYAAQIAFDLPAPTWYACLIDPFVLGLLTLLD